MARLLFTINKKIINKFYQEKVDKQNSIEIRIKSTVFLRRKANFIKTNNLNKMNKENLTRNKLNISIRKANKANLD